MVRNNPKHIEFKQHIYSTTNSEATSITTTKYGFLLHQRTFIFHHYHWEGEPKDNQVMLWLRQEGYPEEAPIHSCPAHQEGFIGKLVPCR